MTEPASLGGKLRAARERLKLRPVDAAKRIGVSKATYSRWESSGEDFPRGRNLQAIHDVLGIPVADLVAAGRSIAAAPPMHSPTDRPILSAPGRAMEDATFREAWRIVGQLWHLANPHKRKARREDVERWRALLVTLRQYGAVGQSPDPAAEEPWPAVGHPLHH